MSGLIKGLLVPLAVIAVFALARRCMPVSAPLPQARLTDHLQVRYKALQWPVGIGTVLCGAFMVWSFHAVLLYVNRIWATARNGAGLQLLPQPAIWWFLPGFAALSLSYELTLQVWAAVGDRREIALYDRWSSSKAGFDSRRVLRWMGLIIALPIGVLTILALPMHATLGDAEIVDCGYAFSRCQAYRCTDARRVSEVEGFRDRDGKLTSRAGLIIDFADGRRWSSAVWGDFRSSVDPQLKTLLSAKIGLPIGHFTAESDVGSPR